MCVESIKQLVTQELSGILCGDLTGTWVQINVVVGFQAYQSTGVCTQWRVGFSELIKVYYVGIWQAR